jgi:hypothetical protein
MQDSSNFKISGPRLVDSSGMFDALEAGGGCAIKRSIANRLYMFHDSRIHYRRYS